MPQPILMAPRRAVDAAIRFYQRRLSPLKGYTCAHVALAGGASCSEAIRLLVAGQGILGAVVPAIVRLAACYRAADLLRAERVRGVCCCGGIPIPFRF